MRGTAKSDYELLQDEMRQLKRENAALRADRERLDWLEEQEGHYWAAKRLYRGDPITRTAIDSARKEKP
jgi:hypothetical protein